MKTIVVAPHPDDETLGAGGTLLRRKAEGGKTAWLIMTAISEDTGWSPARINQRKEEIKRVSELFSFDSVFALDFESTRLDTEPMNKLVSAISNAFNSFAPEEVLIPHPSDAHSDHRTTFDAVVACTKWFRYPSVKRVLAYEVLSETDVSLHERQLFHPNVYVNIEQYLENKLRAMDIYKSETGRFPFPRSHEAIRALAAVRGVASGFNAAEAFQLLRDRS